MDSIKQFLFPIGLSFLILISMACTDEVMKNRSREGIGENIPEGAYGVVVDTSTYSFIGNGHETNYTMKVQVFEAEGDTTITQLITNHDYKFIQIGDTITADSSRDYWLKNYGKPRDKAIRETVFFVLGMVILLILAAVVASFWDTIADFFDRTIIGGIYHFFKSIWDFLFDTDFGFIVSSIIVLLGFLMINLIIGLLIHEAIQDFPPVLEVLKISGAISLTGTGLVFIWSWKNFFKNLRVVSMGTILVGLLVLFSHFVLGLSMGYLVENLLGKLGSH